MKILSTNFNQNTAVQNRITSRPVFEVPKDTFTKSTPTFKGAEQKAAVQGGKVLLELSAFLTAGFVAFKKLTGGSDDINNADLGTENNPFSDFFNKIAGQNDEKLQELKEENDKLKQENSDLKAKLEEKNSAVTEETPKEEPDTEAEIPVQPTTEEVQYATFPPKRGLLSAEQRKLKEVVTKTSINSEYNEKLTEICRNILKMGSKDPENKEKTINLTAELEACGGDKEKLQQVVDKYSDNKDTKTTDSTNPDAVNPEEIKQNGANETPDTGKPNTGSQNGENSAEIYDPVGARRLPGTTQVGTLDLSKVPDRKGKRPRIPRGQIRVSDATSTEGSANSRAALGTSPKSVPDTSAALAISSEESAIPGVYNYNRAGTAPESMKKNLTDALKFYEVKYILEKKQEAKEKGEKPEYIQWMHRRPVGFTRKSDVIREVDNCKNNGASSRYHNINDDNAEFVADAINDDIRFKESFTFHGAAKFIERFVDFNDTEHSIESQASHGLDVLQNTLQRAIKSGVTMEEHDAVYTYKDKAGNEHTEIQKGTNIIIPTECYDREAKKLFGSHPLKLGICRQNKENQALICTVFPEGIY